VRYLVLTVTEWTARKHKKVSDQGFGFARRDAGTRLLWLKDGRTRLGYKAEHVVDSGTGAIVRGGTRKTRGTLASSFSAAGWPNSGRYRPARPGTAPHTHFGLAPDA
jgi:hypothetical protein